MNLENKINENLWKFVRSSYESGNYSNAILDAIHYLSDLLRNKTGLESDGVSLINEALGGEDPILKLNKLQTQSDENIQKGVFFILRGIYQAIRNPRAHEKYSDSVEDADSLIIFINYLAKQVEHSKQLFTKQNFLNNRVFDKDFVENHKYGALLVDEVPQNKRFDIFVDIINKSEEILDKKLKYFLKPLYSSLNDKEKEDIDQLISNKLKETNSEPLIRLIIRTFYENKWTNYEEVARMRIENKILESIRNGRYKRHRLHLIDGRFGTFAVLIANHFVLKENLIDLLISRLKSRNNEISDYILVYHIKTLFKILDNPSQELIKAINKGLSNGDIKFYEAVDELKSIGDHKWFKPFENQYENFEEVEVINDDLPF